MVRALRSPRCLCCRNFPSAAPPRDARGTRQNLLLVVAQVPLYLLLSSPGCRSATRHECGAIGHHDRAISNGNPLMAVRLSAALALLCGLFAGVAASFAQDRAIVLASTTSTQESGLLDYLLPIFRDKTGIDVTVIARRADEVLDGARRGEADVVLMHARPQEEKFVADGFAMKRLDVMYNDYVLIGPRSDPAGVKGKDIATALKAIEAKGVPFVTRGDRSGTHAAELALWIVAGIDIAAAKGAWYREAGQGMAAALEAARTANAYVLSDRGSWIAFRERGDLDIVVEGDKRLLNQYGAMLVNPEKFPTVKKELGQTFIDWLISPEGQ